MAEGENDGSIDGSKLGLSDSSGVVGGDDAVTVGELEGGSDTSEAVGVDDAVTVGEVEGRLEGLAVGDCVVGTSSIPVGC